MIWFLLENPNLNPAEKSPEWNLYSLIPLIPVINSGGKRVLVSNGDGSFPVEDHVFLSLEVVKIEGVDVATESQLSHLTAEPPGTFREVDLDLFQDIEQVGGGGEQDRVQRNLPILLAKINLEYHHTDTSPLYLCHVEHRT